MTLSRSVSSRGILFLLDHFCRVRLFATPWTVARQAPLSMDALGKNTAEGCRVLLQGVFPTRDWTPVSCVSCIGRRVLYHWCHLGSPSSSCDCGLTGRRPGWQLSLLWLERELLENRAREGKRQAESNGVRFLIESSGNGARPLGPSGDRPWPPKVPKQ